MAKANNVIEINGKRYDALSGKPVAERPDTKKHLAPSASGKYMDGVVAKARHPQPATYQRHRKTERSHTLMRGAVKKPAISSPSPAKHSQTFTHAQQNELRLEHAKAIAQSPKISKFGPAHPVIKKLTQVLPVKEPPTEAAVVLKHHPAATLSSKILANPFTKALEQATAHTQPKLKKRSVRVKAAHKLHVSPKIMSVSAASLAVLLLGGFIAYQNVPNLSMRVVAARAGVHASFPGYQPSGFSLRGPIQSQAGQVTLTYRSNSDGRQFSISQHTSSWDSAALVDNYVALNHRQYQTYQSDNKTIYIFDGSNATWINNGVWYQVEGKSSLNSDQLIRIANSM